VTVVEAGLERIGKALSALVVKGRVSEEAQARTMANLVGATTAEELCECDAVIEAVVETSTRNARYFVKLSPF
jgi:3-hydroxyacyl-CoA dehydrogenase